ncbi:hypothetical protein [Radiobacillus deserti]|uniref:Uncharacterized protein n=1 Tax=Radiobacillus deserti TaxID=2594883 RepID=A0A516KFD8_9BACI|nr:hypothetical protein [Radiobacillus deserti]QDP40121.1 hypothetical protein FN924_08040 [Radiobacillus deserti]
MKKIRSFLIFFLPFVLFFFYFTSQSEKHHFSAHSINKEHGNVEIPKGLDIPSLQIKVTQDQSKTWLLEVQTDNFTFAPRKVGSYTRSYNEGHAHLFINGEKINRLYGSYYNLGVLRQGKHTIKVTLNSNTHEFLMYGGKRIEDSLVVKVGS